MQDFRNLEVWRTSYNFALAVYRLSRSFPREELYGLTSQLRRASMSIPLNIAEGCGRQSDLDFSRMLHIAIGSAFEVECLLMMVNDLEFASSEVCDEHLLTIASIRRMLNALIQRVKPTP